MGESQRLPWLVGTQCWSKVKMKKMSGTFQIVRRLILHNVDSTLRHSIFGKTTSSI